MVDPLQTAMAMSPINTALRSCWVQNSTSSSTSWQRSSCMLHFRPQFALIDDAAPVCVVLCSPGHVPSDHPSHKEQSGRAEA